MMESEMALSSRIKDGLNLTLKPLNLKLGTLAAENAEHARLEALARGGQFEAPTLPLLPQFAACDPAPVFEALVQYAGEIDALEADPASGYRFDNAYFYSPDAEVAYGLARSLKPGRIVEVGSGNSTFLFRAAISAGGLNSSLISIDPYPRRDIEAAADRIIRQKAEDTSVEEFQVLSDGDFLFIDSSHEVRAGNDVVHLLLNVAPTLKPGVVVHIHDIFLPYEYPREWVRDYGWTEQYLVQAMLQGSTDFEVIWPAHYLQRTRPDFTQRLPRSAGRNGASLWLRKTR